MTTAADAIREAMDALGGGDDVHLGRTSGFPSGVTISVVLGLRSFAEI
jgi:hypothetical protein